MSLAGEPEDSHQSDISLSEFLFQVSNVIFSVPLELAVESIISFVDCYYLISFPLKSLKVLNEHVLALLPPTAAEA